MFTLVGPCTFVKPALGSEHRLAWAAYLANYNKAVLKEARRDHGTCDCNRRTSGPYCDK